jgi:hypothetical protein
MSASPHQRLIGGPAHDHRACTATNCGEHFSHRPGLGATSSAISLLIHPHEHRNRECVALTSGADHGSERRHSSDLPTTPFAPPRGLALCHFDKTPKSVTPASPTMRIRVTRCAVCQVEIFETESLKTLMAHRDIETESRGGLVRRRDDQAKIDLLSPTRRLPKCTKPADHSGLAGSVVGQRPMCASQAQES